MRLNTGMGTEPPTVRKQPGLVKYGNITSKWGIADSLDVYNWRKQAEEEDEGCPEEHGDRATQPEGQPASRWEFSQAWPTKYSAPSLNATANEIAIETLEIAHEGMKRTK